MRAENTTDYIASTIQYFISYLCRGFIFCRDLVVYRGIKKSRKLWRSEFRCRARWLSNRASAAATIGSIMGNMRLVRLGGAFVLDGGVLHV